MPYEQQSSVIMEQESLKLSKSPGVWVTGFALFSMFFGAGNLIFPLMIGHTSGQNNIYALCGLVLTAVVVPFIGLFSMMLYEASYEKFFSRLGSRAGKLIIALLIAIQGPFAALPRLITLMHATFKAYFPGVPLLGFSLAICSIVFVLSARKNKLIDMLGKFLTPVLFASLICFVYFGIKEAPSPHAVEVSPFQCFKEGLIGGYNTTDLVASFLFAALVLPFLRKGSKEKSETSSKGFISSSMVKASLIASFLLLFVYTGLSYVSSYHVWTLGSTPPPEALISTISIKLLGPYGSIVASLAVFFACLTTAITLIHIFADYVKEEVSSGKVNTYVGMVIGLAISFGIANLGFSGIAKILSPLLQIVYPGLILMSFLNIAYCRWGFKPIKTPVFLTFLGSAIAYFFF